jgi:starch synthase
MYAMRYGSIPIVTDVGGLHDTVEPIVRGAGRTFGDVGTGFVAAGADLASFRDSCEEAIDLFADPPAHARAVVRAMGRDFSWAGPARKYLALYREIVGGG